MSTGMSDIPHISCPALRSLLASQGGVALLIVLWVLTMLMVIVLSFSFMTRTETHATLTFREGIEKKFLAESGIQRAIMELFYRNTYKGQTVVLEGKEVWRVDGTSYEGETGNGSYTVKITDESGKIDINYAPDVLLKNFFIHMGVSDQVIDTLVDSIMDWKDPDDLHRLSGAESDYYQSLPKPYKAKDANFDTVEELLLVKGMTPEILYGDGTKPGAIEFLTVHSRSATINVTSAPKEVLMAIPGMTEELADGIISDRETQQEETHQPAIPTEGRQYASFGATTAIYTIESVGRKGTDKTGHAIRATVMIDSAQNTQKYLYYKSPAIVHP